MTSDIQQSNQERLREKDFLYTALDLPVFATESEIKERHRALSLLFHPDRQHDGRLKETATKNFHEIQFAYEVLSDPFRREVYDTLGYEGLTLKFPEHFKTLPLDELRPALREFFYENRIGQLQSQINSGATVTCHLDARELFYDGWPAGDWYTDLSERFAATRMNVLSLRHSFSKRLGQQTRLQVISRVGSPIDGEEDRKTGLDAGRFSLLRGNVSGVIIHRYSATEQLQVRASLPNWRSVNVSWTHTGRRNMNVLRVSTPLRPSLAFPTISINLRQRLFRDSLTLGSIDCVVSRVGLPTVTLGLTRPSALRKGATFASGWATSLSLRGQVPGPMAQFQWWGEFPYLSMVLKVGSEASALGGLANTIEGSWHSESGESDVSSAVVWSARGVALRLSFTHLGQTLSLPITLSDENLSHLVILATVAQASAFAMAEYFLLRKLRAKKRERRREEHEIAQQDQLSQKRVGAETVMKMLENAARRSRETEKTNDGLIILEARYFPLEDSGTPMPDLGIDVTTAIQALVHNGQLFIPGERSKSLLRGFYDPLPECKKRLSVRYEFRGRMHYAEVGERAPLVLPLESHQVEHANGVWSKPISE